MAISHIELIGSVDGVDSTNRESRHKRMYQLFGSDNIDDMRTYLNVNGLRPDTEDGLIYRSAERVQVWQNNWIWTINYEQPQRADESTNDKLDVGEFSVSFDNSGATAKVFWTPDPDNNVTAYPQGTPPFAIGTHATDYKGAIEVRDGQPQGTEIPIPSLRFDIHYRHSRTASALEFLAYGDAISELVGRTNLLNFFGFDVERVLYLGSSGKNGTDSDPVLDHHFIAGKHLTDLIFDTITGVSKKAHEFLWVQYEPIKAPDTKVIKPKVIGVYVHKLREPVDFAALGIGS